MAIKVDENGDGIDDRSPGGGGEGRGPAAPVGTPDSSGDVNSRNPALTAINTLISKVQAALSSWDPSKELQADLQDIIDGKGQAFDRTTAKVDDANARMKSISASGRAGLLGILNGQNATAIQSQVGNQAARTARTEEQAGARALLAQVLASGQDLDVASAQEQLNQLSESVVPGDPLAVLAPIAGATMTAFNVWSQSQKDKKKTPSNGQQNNANAGQV